MVKGLSRTPVIVLLLVILMVPCLASSGQPEAFILTSDPVTEVSVGELYAYRITANREIWSVVINSGPRDMDISDNVIHWKPQLGQEGKYEIRFKATDQEGIEATQSFILKVERQSTFDPMIIILSPNDGVRFEARQALEIVGVVGTDHDQVELWTRLNKGSWTKRPISGTERWTVDYANGLKPGRYSFLAAIYDTDGRFLADVSLNFEVLAVDTVSFRDAAVTSTSISLVIITLVVAGMTEVGKYKLVGLVVVPLYTRIRKEKMLDQFTRGQIFQYIKNNPGETYSTIKKSLSLNNGTLTHHLQHLERGDLVTSKRNGTFRHFYSTDIPLPKEVFRLGHVQKDVIEILRANPGLSQTEIARELDITRQKLNYHIKVLLTAGIVGVHKRGKSQKCYLKKN